LIEAALPNLDEVECEFTRLNLAGILAGILAEILPRILPGKVSLQVVIDSSGVAKFR